MPELLAPLDGQIDRELPPLIEEGRWLATYCSSGCAAGPPIMLSLGETWSGPPQGILDALARAPGWTHGYQLSPYGLPALRRVLSDQLAAEHKIGARMSELRVAVTWTGTRSAMADVGALAGRQLGDRMPVLLAPGPGWDYAGVFEPLGFRTVHYPLLPERGFVLDPDDARAAAATIDANDEALAVVVINAQHNPTGVDQCPEAVGALVELARRHDAIALIDDAHHWLHPVDQRPTSAVRELLSRNADSRWIMLRSLGKQLSCNGWGIGVMLGPRADVDDIVRTVIPARFYNTAGHLQWALADWLTQVGPQKHTEGRRVEHASNRALVVNRLLELGFPADGLIGGECAPFLLVALPPAFTDGPTFRRQLFARTGVMTSDPWPLARHTSTPSELPYFRIHLGSPAHVLDEALDRLRDAGVTYAMTQSDG